MNKDVLCSDCPARWPDRTASRAAMGEWQEIESAPRDGTDFLAYSQDFSQHMGDPLPSFISLCAWHPDAGFCTDELRHPTHWMPLPTPPKGD